MESDDLLVLLPPTSPCTHPALCCGREGGKEGSADGWMDELMAQKSFADTPSFHRGREVSLKELCREDLAPDLGPG